ncbi:hypothetical protein BCL57_002165 [Agromyces flavus]|uniref:Uncharacterized protein n=1 Tax=Agromyces flavus TaxID=589382 RepID=A0A1H1P1E4_9MICO|nr:hypothetical protein [Agromyces flavus]SDS05024.1 hypothetical protein SAMN04489721_0695 [Agromyces flavus]
MSDAELRERNRAVVAAFLAADLTKREERLG